MVSTARLKHVPSGPSCESSTVIDRDGAANLRSAPNGTVIGAVRHGETVLVVGQSGEWRRVMTDRWQSGFIHSSRLIR